MSHFCLQKKGSSLLGEVIHCAAAPRQSLSDDKLLTCIDGALKSDAFPKIHMKDSRLAALRDRVLISEIQYTGNGSPYLNFGVQGDGIQ